jgi:putative sterol carrier protein
VHGRSEEDIEAYATAFDGGVPGLLDLVFGNLPGAFLPDRAGGKPASFQFVIAGPAETYEYFVDVHDGRCETGRGRVADPGVTMRMDLPVFLRVLTGVIHPVRALMTRKIGVSGDMMTATKFESWFQRP